MSWLVCRCYPSTNSWLYRSHWSPIKETPIHPYSQVICFHLCSWPVCQIKKMSEFLSCTPNKCVPFASLNSKLFFAFFNYSLFLSCFPALLFFFFFWPCRTACGILVPQPGIKPMPPAVEAWSLNHWTAREVPVLHSLLPFLFSFWKKVQMLPRYKSNSLQAFISPFWSVLMINVFETAFFSTAKIFVFINSVY